MDEGKATRTFEFDVACYLVERELKRLRVVNAEFEYSEGCSVHGSKGSHRAVSLYEAIRGLQKKLDRDTTK